MRTNVTIAIYYHTFSLNIFDINVLLEMRHINYTVFASGSTGSVRLFNLHLDLDYTNNVLLRSYYTHDLDDLSHLPDVHPLTSEHMEDFQAGHSNTVDVFIVPNHSFESISMPFYVYHLNVEQQYIVFMTQITMWRFDSLSLQGDDNFIAGELIVLAASEDPRICPTSTVW